MALVRIIKTQLMVVLLTNVFRRLKGKAYLSEDNEFFNPVRGMFAYQIARRGWYMSRRISAVIWRFCISCFNNDCLLNNNLCKTLTQRVPGPGSLRQAVRGRKYADPDEGKRRVRAMIMHHVRCLINDRDVDPSTMAASVKHLLEHDSTATNKCCL